MDLRRFTDIPRALFSSSPLYSFSWAAMTNYRSRWLKTTEIFSVPVLEARSPNSSCWQGCFPSEDSREEDILVFSKFWWPKCSLASRRKTSISTFTRPSPLSVSSSASQRTPGIGFRAHLCHPGCPHLEILKRITSAKTSSPNNIHRF